MRSRHFSLPGGVSTVLSSRSPALQDGLARADEERALREADAKRAEETGRMEMQPAASVRAGAG